MIRNIFLFLLFFNSYDFSSFQEYENQLSIYLKSFLESSKKLQTDHSQIMDVTRNFNHILFKDMDKATAIFMFKAFAKKRLVISKDIKPYHFFGSPLYPLVDHLFRSFHEFGDSAKFELSLSNREKWLFYKRNIVGEGRTLEIVGVKVD